MDQWIRHSNLAEVYICRENWYTTYLHLPTYESVIYSRVALNGARTVSRQNKKKYESNVQIEYFFKHPIGQFEK